MIHDHHRGEWFTRSSADESRGFRNGMLLLRFGSHTLGRRSEKLKSPKRHLLLLPPRRSVCCCSWWWAATGILTHETNFGNTFFWQEADSGWWRSESKGGDGSEQMVGKVSYIILLLAERRCEAIDPGWRTVLILDVWPGGVAQFRNGASDQMGRRNEYINGTKQLKDNRRIGRHRIPFGQLVVARLI